MDSMYKLEQEAIERVIEELEYLAKDGDFDPFNPDDFNDISDIVFQAVDSTVPVYTGDLLQLAANHIALATDEPELGPAFDGTPTPVNIIAANVFESLEAAVYEWWSDVQRDGLEIEISFKPSAFEGYGL